MFSLHPGLMWPQIMTGLQGAQLEARDVISDMISGYMIIFAKKYLLITVDHTCVYIYIYCIDIHKLLISLIQKPYTLRMAAADAGQLRTK